MSEPALFGLIRGGQPRYFADRWSAVFLYREILWGPTDFETWATAHEELEEFDGDGYAGVVVDYDRKRLIWCSDTEMFQVPKVSAVYVRLLEAAWPGYEVAFATSGYSELARALGCEEPDEPYEEERTLTVREAGRYYDDDEEDFDDEEDEDEARFDEDDIRAWITIVDPDGAVRHRHLDQIPANLLDAQNDPLDALLQLESAEVPPEGVVAEGMWIDQAKQTVGLWGGTRIREEVDRVRNAWEGWHVEVAEQGYAEQCAVSGPPGVPLSDAEALAKFLPVVLSTKRFDAKALMGAIGGGIKSVAVKATGCLLVVICLPLVIFGLVSGDWKSTGIAIAITVLIIVVVFKVIEYRFKKSFSNIPAHDGADESPPVAGPLDEKVRRQRIDALLAAANLPPLAKVEPLFGEDSDLDLFT